MATLRFLLKRFAAQRLLGLAVVVTLAFSVGVLVAGPIYADAAREAIYTSTLSDQAVTVRNARFQLYGDPSFDWQTADDAIRSAARRVPLTEVVAQGLGTVRLGGVEGPSVPFLFREGAGSHLRLQGEPPGPNEIAVSGDTARRLRLERGDTVVVVGPTDEQLELTLSGTLEAPGRGDPFWYGSRSPFPAPESTDPVPVLVDRDTGVDAARRLSLTTQFSWDAFLALDGVPFEEARTVPADLRAIEDDLRSEPGLEDFRALSGLDTVFRLVDQRVQNLRIPILLVVFQIGAVTLAVLAGVGALTLSRQTFELAVLHSRGFSRGTLLAAQGLQAVLGAMVAYPLGLLVGTGLASLAGRSNGPALPGVLFPVRLTAGAELLGLLAALVGIAILLSLSVPVVSRTVLQERRAASREGRPFLARVPVELFVLPVGIFAFLQLRGGTKPEPGSGSIDPLVLAAPTLLLFGASFLALRLFLFLLHRLDRRIGRARWLPAYLAGRRLGRSTGTGSAAALLLLLSMGLLVVSTSYRAIVLRNHEDSAHVQVGADWNVSVAPPEQVLAALGDLPPDTTPVVRTDVSFEGGSFSLPPTAVAIDPATFEAGGWWREDFSETSLPDILERLDAPPLGQPLPPGAATLALELEVPKRAAGLTVTATTVADDGNVGTAEPATLREGRNAYELALPASGGRLLSITFQTETFGGLRFDIAIGVTSASLNGEPVDLTGWGPITWRGSTGTATPNRDGVRYEFRPGAGDVIGGIMPATGPLPALLSVGVSGELGNSFTPSLAGQQVELQGIATATQFPGTVPNAPFVVVSTRALLERQFAIPEAGLTLNEVWSNGPESPVEALRARGFATGTVQATAPIEGLLAQLPQSLAVGMNFTAALAGLGLVIVGVAAGLYFTMRRRDYEFAALRAMGTEAAQIRRTLVLEQTGLLGFALVAGLAIGYGLLRLMMPYVGTSLGVSYPPPVLVLDRTALIASIVAIVVATGLALAAATRFLMRSSVTGVLRGEAE